MIALIVACCLWGGGSRSDIPGLILLQPFAILCLVAFPLLPGEMRWGSVQAPLLMLAALAAIMAVQLLPLPPSLWRALPGQAQFQPFAALAGGDQLWRPLTLTPDATLAALVGLATPAAVLVGLAALRPEQSRRLLLVLLGVAGVSVLFALLQIVGARDGFFYRYAITNEGTAVGLFANRNHQAFFMTLVWPMLALWATRPAADAGARKLRRWIAGAAAVALVPVIVVTGSRGGLVLALPALLFGWWLLRTGRGSAAKEKAAKPPIWRTALPLVAAGVAALGVAVTLSRAEALERLFATNISDEDRLSFVPTLLRMAHDFFPFGSGFGSFDPVFRFYEPDALLRPTYLNHAHNDLLELAITGGVPALALLGLLLAWMSRRSWLIIRSPERSSDIRFAQLALVGIALILVGSILDYPLRTPLFALIFALFSGWLAAAEGSSARRGSR